MKIKSGVPEFSKNEIKNIKKLIEHSRRDIDYREGGTFGDGDNFDTNEAKRVECALSIIEHLVSCLG